MATIHETTDTNGDIQVFTEAYAKSHWTFRGAPGNGVVDTKNLPSSIKITGSDNGQSQDSIYVTRITKDGAIAFDWSFTSDDNQESFEINGKPTSFDSFGYLLDGKFFELAYKNSSGTASIEVKAGVEFGFQVRTLDANFAKPGKAIITYFISPNAIMVDSSGFKPESTTTGEVVFGKIDSVIAIRKIARVPVKVKYNGQDVTEKTIAGWKPLAASQDDSTGRYGLYFYNQNTNQHAKWDIDYQGAFVQGEILTQKQLLLEEEHANYDFNADTTIGRKYVAHKSLKGDIGFGTTEIGLAIETKSKELLQVKAGGNYISLDKLGWMVVAAKERSNGEVDIYLRNDDEPLQFAKWRINSLGSIIKGEFYSYAQLLNDEKSDFLDYDSDDIYGASYAETSSKGDVGLGYTQLGIALLTKDQRVVQVTAGGKDISHDKLGWTPTAAKERKDGEVDIYLRNDDEPLQFAKWRINSLGSMIKGEYYTLAQLLADEKSDFRDYDDDGIMGDDTSGEPMKMVESSVSITIDPDVMHLVLTGTASINGTGNSFDNIIDGNVGSNILDGKEGRDVLTGGDGADTYVFSTISPTAFGLAGADHITDFRPASGDKIQIQRNAFRISNTAESTLSAVSGDVAVEAALSTTALFVYDSSKGFLFWNNNGTGSGYGDGGVFAILDNMPTGLIAAHILLA